jgi:predicted AAA+ superfamily ATPase
MGVTDRTVQHYVDLLRNTFMVRQLSPWHENIAKRQVKAPKIFIHDSGLLHSLLDIRDFRQLEGHPKLGASWEGFCLEALVRHLGARTDSPRETPSIRAALEDLRLDSVDVIYPGTQTFPLSKWVRAVGIERISQDIAPLAP